MFDIDGVFWTLTFLKVYLLDFCTKNRKLYEVKNALAMYTVLRMAKLHTPANLNGVNKHNTRSIPVKNADPDLQSWNYRLVGTDNLNKDVNARLNQVGIDKVRKNGVRAVEWVISASPEFFGKETIIQEDGSKTIRLNGGSFETRDFFNQSKQWLEDRFGKENLVNFVVHLDEKTPHAHAVIVPLNEKNKLSARTVIGNKTTLSEHQTSFAEAVERFGIQRGVKGSKAKHQSIQKFYSKVEKFEGDIEKAIEQDPEDIRFEAPSFKAPERESKGFLTKENDEEYRQRIEEQANQYVKAVQEQMANKHANVVLEQRRDFINIAREGVIAHQEKEVIRRQEKEIKSLKSEINTLHSKINKLTEKLDRFKKLAHSYINNMAKWLYYEAKGLSKKDFGDANEHLKKVQERQKKEGLSVYNGEKKRGLGR